MHGHPGTGAPLAIADVFRRFAPAFRQRHPLSPEPARVLDDLERCRTAALGVHPYRCDDCGRDVPLFNSCLNRHAIVAGGGLSADGSQWIEPPDHDFLFPVAAVLRPTSRYFTRSAPLPTPSHRYVRVARLHRRRREPQAHALTRAVADAVQAPAARILSAPTRAASPAPVTRPGQFHPYAHRSSIAVRVGSAP